MQDIFRKKRGFFVVFEHFYDGNRYKFYMLLPGILFIVFAFLVLVFPTVPKGIDLQGGTLIIIRSDNPIDATQLKQDLSEKFDLLDLKVNSISGPAGNGVNVQFAGSTIIINASQQVDSAKALLATNPDAAMQNAQTAVNGIARYLKSTELPSQPDKAVPQAELYLIEASKNLNQQIRETIVQEFSLSENVAFQLRDVSPTLSASFWQTAINVAIMSTIFITIVIFAFFRKFIPTVAVLQAAAFDVLGALAMMAVFGIPLSLSSIPALLMLVGYSVDTDIMLTTRMLQRREGSPAERAAGSLATGLTMTGTTLAALTSMAIVSFFGQIYVIFEISIVLLFGLTADLISTWFMNTGILLWYTKRQRKGAF